MSTTSRPRKTVDDLLALGDEVRAELIAGELYMAASPTPWHQTILGQLYYVLRQHLEGDKTGQIFVAPLDVYLPSGDVVEPDLIYVRSENVGIVKDWIRGVPDLLVEIVSPSNPERDRIVKKNLYAENGVPEYWIVEPEARAVEVLRLEGGDYVPAGYFRIGSRLETPTFPKLSVPIDEVFR